jgi:hypothetical protein
LNVHSSARWSSAAQLATAADAARLRSGGRAAWAEQYSLGVTLAAIGPAAWAFVRQPTCRYSRRRAATGRAAEWSGRSAVPHWSRARVTGTTLTATCKREAAVAARYASLKAPVLMVSTEVATTCSNVASSSLTRICTPEATVAYTRHRRSLKRSPYSARLVGELSACVLTARCLAWDSLSFLRGGRSSISDGAAEQAAVADEPLLFGPAA